MPSAYGYPQSRSDFHSRVDRHFQCRFPLGLDGNPPTCLKLSGGLCAQFIQPSCQDIRFNLLIPQVSLIFLKPRRKPAQFRRRKLRDCRLDFLNAHKTILP